MKKNAVAGGLKLTWEEIGFLCQGMSLASQPMDLAVKDISDEYSLGPRGPWIAILIATGQIYPLDLAKLFRVGRSLITAELTRLAAAGLVEFEQNAQDGRRTELKLTPLGNTVQRRVRDELSKLMLRRLDARDTRLPFTSSIEPISTKSLCSVCVSTFPRARHRLPSADTWVWARQCGATSFVSTATI